MAKKRRKKTVILLKRNNFVSLEMKIFFTVHKKKNLMKEIILIFNNRVWIFCFVQIDLSAAVACSSSSVSLSNMGRSGPGSSWRLTAGSAPVTPRTTPPVSPQHWPRRVPSRQTPQLPVPPESPSPLT